MAGVGTMRMRWHSYRDEEIAARLHRACAALGYRRKRTKEEDGGVAGRAYRLQVKKKKRGSGLGYIDIIFLFFFHRRKEDAQIIWLSALVIL